MSGSKSFTPSAKQIHGRNKWGENTDRFLTVFVETASWLVLDVFQKVWSSPTDVSASSEMTGLQLAD